MSATGQIFTEATPTARSSASELLGSLPVTIDGYRLRRGDQHVSGGWVRPSTVIELHGGGFQGEGEDVSYDIADHDALAAAAPLGLAGSYTLDSFSRRLDQLPISPFHARAHSAYFRRWAFESAALDLALCQAGLSLGEALDRPYQPVRFVISTRLDPRLWLEIDPAIELKLDPTPDWTDVFMDALAATGRVRILDFKSHHLGSKLRQPANPDLYRRVIERFPDAIIEDVVLTDQTRQALLGAEQRLSWDSPIHSIADTDALPLRPNYLNIKPSRFGTIRALFDCLTECEHRHITFYGGGHYELGPGRRQIQALASLFYPDAPNDVAPPAYNEPTPRPGLPPSPLDPPA